MPKKMTNREALRQAYETITRTKEEIRKLTNSTGYMACFHHHCDHPVFSVWIAYSPIPSPATELHYTSDMKLDTEQQPSPNPHILTLIESWLDREPEPEV